MTLRPAAAALLLLAAAAAPVAAEDLGGPLDLRPATAAPPSVAKPAKPVRRIAVPPLPRLRPTRDAAVAAVSPDPLPAPAEALPVVPAVAVAGPVAAEPAVAVVLSTASPPPPAPVADAAPAAPAVRIVGAPAAPPPSPETTGSTLPSAPAVLTPAPPPPSVAAVPPPPPPPPTDDIPGDPATSGFTAPLPAPSVLDPAIAGVAIAADAPLRPTLVRTPPVLPREPYRLVRMLQTLQDGIAQGSSDALAAQRTLRDRIDDRFLVADATVWRDPRNAEAAVTYALSGGRPDVLKRLAALDPRPPVDMRLVSGALAYVEGRDGEARDNLLALDALSLPASMGAAVALAQAALVVQSDPPRALRLLDTARLLAPGTLVEEAALRREIFVADQTGQVVKLEALVGQYLRRFRHSVYAGNFRVRLAGAVSRIDFGASDADRARLDGMLALLDPAARADLYLTVAVAALVKGKAPVAAFAAGRAAELAVPGSPEMARAKLYAAAALAVDPAAFDTAVADLKAVDRYRLDASDAALYAVASATVDAIASGTVRPATPPAAPDADAADPAIDRAKESLRLADAVLAEASR